MTRIYHAKQFRRNWILLTRVPMFVCIQPLKLSIGIPTNFHLLIFMKGNYQELPIMAAS